MATLGHVKVLSRQRVPAIATRFHRFVMPAAFNRLLHVLLAAAKG
jgi:hypothetical protein